MSACQYYTPTLEKKKGYMFRLFQLHTRFLQRSNQSHGTEDSGQPFFFLPFTWILLILYLSKSWNFFNFAFSIAIAAKHFLPTEIQDFSYFFSHFTRPDPTEML